MFDLYGLPSDCPGVNTVGAREGRARARHLENAMNQYFQSPRFMAHLMVHEFEGIAYSSPTTTARVLLSPDLAGRLQAERDQFASAEDVNDGHETHPSKRLKNHFPQYQKAAFGPAIASAIGIAQICQDCPHFHEWLQVLEQL
jgi:hypothetical protein